jgi:release factor glutamine methyltransferase
VSEQAATLDRLVAHAGLRLKAAGVAEPRREAWRIWADLKGLSSHTGSILSEEVIPGGEAERFRKAVDRRARGEPLPYVTGLAGFRELTLHCDRRALIPRPETEGLVELVLARMPGGRVADIGTGTGCIALSLADEGRYDLILGVDESREALNLAAENCAATRLGVALVHGDLVESLGDATLDAVVSNPPYLTEAEYACLDPSVKSWEPRAALASGEDGLLTTRRLVADALRVVKPEGWIALEIDSTRGTETARLAEDAGWSDVSLHDDPFGRARYLLARRSEML